MMAYFFIFSGVILRLLPHPANFAPIAAMALFGGVYLNKKYALGVPLLAMLLGDLIIGFYSPWVMLSVYGSFILIGFIGLWLRDHKKIGYVLGGSLLGSVIFYVVTNFAVWAAPPSLYPHTLQGLSQSYIMGLPFFRNTLIGDLFYVGAMFSLMELVIYLSNNFQIKKERYGFRLARVARKRI